MLTRELVTAMNEAELRAKVLVPLLQGMGFQDVFEYHGGPGEQGKDIVCWKADELGARVNLAVVAKAKPINGQAQTSHGTAGEAYMQVSQSFGNPYKDPRTGEACGVHQCWLVSSQTISKEAVESIHSALAPSHLDQATRFVAGDKLWELIEKYLPVAAAFQKLAEAAHVLDSVDEHYRLQVRIAGQNLEIGIGERYPGASSDKPFTIKAEFTFPTTPEGQQAREAFERFLSSGAEVDIPPQFIQTFEMPEFMNKVLGGYDPKTQHLFWDQPPNPVISCSVQICCARMEINFQSNISICA